MAKQEESERKQNLRISTRALSPDQIKNILVFCTGNICRSPMAMGIIKTLLWARGINDVEVRSAGTMNTFTSPASEPAIEVCAECGIDISSHRSAPLSSAAVQKADILLTMEKAHLHAIRSRYAYAIDKTFLLCDFSDPAKDSEIDDPIGMNISFYRRSLEKIYRCSVAFIDWLTREKGAV